MAKRAKDLGDWKVVSDDPAEDISRPSTPTRRTRRGASEPAEGKIKLLRESDGTLLTKGDCILVSGEPRFVNTPGDSYHAVVTDICTGIHKYLEIHVAPLVQPRTGDSDEDEDEQDEDVKDEDVKDEKNEKKSEKPEFHTNELLLTSEVNEVLLRDIVEKVQVLSSAQFAEVAIDESSESSVFLCRRSTDRYLERFSPEFDFSEWKQLLFTSYGRAIEFLAEKTSVIISPNKKRAPTTSIQDRIKQSPSPSKKSYVYISDSDEDSWDDGLGLSSEDEDEDDDDDPDDEPAVAVKAKRKYSPRKRKAGSAPVTPKKRSREMAKDTGVFQQVASVLSPHNRGFKVKTGSTMSSLPSLSREASDIGVNSGRYASSEAFRELKEKLHTSTRVASLPCREEQFEYVYMNLESAVMEKMGCCLYLSGTPGVGKTATVREAIGALRDSVKEGYVDDFDYLEINCLKLLTPNSAYEKLYEHVSGIKVTPSNASLLLEEYFSRETLDTDRKPLIVLVDELDQLVTKNQKVIYNFFNWPTYQHSRLIVLAVANTMDLPERALSNKIASRLGLRRFAFRGYTEDELGIIIAHRLTLLSESNKRKVEISTDAMRFASKKVSLVSGDARRALTICRRAVEIAEQEYLESNDTEDVPEEKQCYSVRISHIGKAISETVNSPVAQVLDGLSFAAKLLLVGVLLRIRRSGQGENPLGDIMDEMRNSLQLLTTKGSTHALRDLSDDANYISLLYGDKRMDSAKSHVRLHNITQIVNELVEQGILAQQNIRSDRYRLISLNISEEEITPVIKRDVDIAAMF
ncbi:hypothetical protein JCM33374_g3491 [Metschnikowia sp. JCM 33374]|nr:hypothetical protein JCM33374_g3491 [Metschnikowia sp. JCM 33374]